MNTPGYQQGVALLIIVLALLSGSALILANEYRSGIRNDRLESVLAAKQALIAYAVNYADDYGHNTRGGTGRLPCPSLQRYGSPARSCRENEIGYLPSVWMRNQRLMEIDYLERFFDQDIWYAVSADHRYNPAFNTLNSYPDTGLFSVDSMHEVVAVLISPGTALGTQHRGAVSGQLPGSAIAEYLEGENADMDNAFTLTNQNDLLVPIRRSELIPLMERKVLGYAKQWLIEYKQLYGYYPYASALGGDGQCVSGLTRGEMATEAGSCTGQPFLDMAFVNLPGNRVLRDTWFARYDWPALIYYLVDESCTEVRGATDCDGVNDPARTLHVNGEPAEVILFSVGAPIDTLPVGGMQVRSTPDLAQYLDTNAVLSAVDSYPVPVRSAVSNDQVVIIN